MVRFRVRFCVALGLLVCASFWTTFALAGELEDFQAARAAYDARRFEDAASLFGSMLGTSPTPNVKNDALRLECRKYLGASYFFLGKKNEGNAQFEKLLREDPTYTLDPAQFPREVLAAFAAQKKIVQAELAEKSRLARLEEENAKLKRTLEKTKASEARLVESSRYRIKRKEHSRWIGVLPFGIGQFQNGHKVGGYAFLIAQGLTFAGSIALFFTHLAVRNLAVPPLPGQPPRDGGIVYPTPAPSAAQQRYTQLEEGLRIANWITSIALGVLIVAGIADAQIRFVPYVEVREKRASAGFSWTF